MCAYQRSWDKASRDAWERQRLAQDIASGNVKRNAKIDAFLAGGPKLKAPNKHYGPANFNDLLKPLNHEAKKTLGDKIAENMRESEGKKKKQPTKSKMRRALANGGELHAVMPSDCFQDLYAVASDDDGMVLVSGVFANPTRGEWQYEMTLDEFLDWANDDLGVAFNEWVRGNYEV